MEQAIALSVVEEETHEELFESWLAWLAHRELSPNTIRLYSRTIEQAHEDLGELRALERKGLERWVQSKGGTSGTKSNRVSALTSFYRFLVRTERRDSNPATDIERPKTHKRLPKPVEDLEAVLALADEADRKANERGAIPRRVGETRDMIVFMAYTGLRMHEAKKCDWPVPCPEEAFIIGKGNKEELMQIHPKAREAWDRIGGEWPIGARATQRRFEKLGIHPHMCRHWRATSLVRAGVEIGQVSKIMRHSSVQTTMGYSAYALEAARDALALVP